VGVFDAGKPADKLSVIRLSNALSSRYVPSRSVYDRHPGIVTVIDLAPDQSAPSPMDAYAPSFWKRKRLSEMTQAEWESLCDGCGRCCLNKLEEEGTGRTFFTDVACRLFDADTCRCRDYANRQAKVKDCVRLTPRNVRRLVWLPPTCAYVLVAQGRDLAWWHPLVSGDPETVHAAGISLRGRALHDEKDVPDKELERHIVSWPARAPKAARQPPARKANKERN
jgi:uncharacterized cysteine cluster protein YcgN (CxxCxxCC family)